MEDFKYLTRHQKKKLNIPNSFLCTGLTFDEKDNIILKKNKNNDEIKANTFSNFLKFTNQYGNMFLNLFDVYQKNQTNNFVEEKQTKNENSNNSGIIQIMDVFSKDKKKKKEKENDDEKNNKENDENDKNEDEDEDEDEDSYDENDIWYNYEEEEYLKKLKKSKKKKKQKLLAKIEKQEEKLKNFKNVEVPFRFRILNSKLSLPNKKTIIDQLDHYHELDESSSEYYKLKSWIDSVDKIPFDNYHKLPIKITDSSDKIDEYLKNAYDCLEKSVYGHQDAKMQILQIISKWITNPKSNGNVIALCGPMGNGKTTLVKKGVSKAIDKPFAFMGLGGATDSAYLNGHDYTYEGAKCGRIVEMLMETKCMDPIIFFDELDKISETSKGKEISNMLCHLTDPSQNDKFHDKYFSGIDFDLSKALFIFSLNNEKLINPILKDRITVINMKGFKIDEKINIIKDYLLPELYKEYNFPNDQIIFKDDILKYLINNYTKEEGVRQIKQLLDCIISKLNLYKLTSQTNLFDKQNYTFPLTLTIENVQQLIKKKDLTPISVKMMYM